MPQGGAARSRLALQGLPRCAHTLLLASVLCCPASRAWGYRPFVSTDAAVVTAKEVEIELGSFTLERTQGDNTLTIPSLVLNYGFLTNVELVGELRVQRSPTHTIDVVDPGLFVKTVLREGVLQDKDGISVAIEAGPLLPSTMPGERRLGFEGVGIVSHRVSPFTFHWNIGGGVDREETRPFGVWGVITELPIGTTVRLVVEVSGESVQRHAANHAVLFGVLWQPPWLKAVVDAGIRKGFSRGAPDWLFTMGLTFGFPLPGSGHK